MYCLSVRRQVVSDLSRKKGVASLHLTFRKIGESKLFVLPYRVSIDKIIAHLKLTFIAERPPPSQAQPQLAVAAEDRVEYI